MYHIWVQCYMLNLLDHVRSSCGSRAGVEPEARLRASWLQS